MSLQNLPLLLGIAALVFGLRSAGFYRKQQALPEFWNRFFQYLPLGALTALVVPNLAGSQGEWLPRLAGAVTAALSVYFTRQLWIGLVAGMLVFWLGRGLVRF